MIKTNLKLLVAILLLSSPAMAQKYMTKSGHIDFYSSTPMEDIEAHNKQVNAALDTKKWRLCFQSTDSFLSVRKGTDAGAF